MRYKIIKPVDCDWDLLGQILRDLQYDTRQIMNKAIQYCWEWQGFSSEYKEILGEYPKPRETFGYSGISGYCYDRLKKEYIRLNTGNLTTSITNAIQRWKTDMKDTLRGNKSIANFKADVPIDLHNETISVFKEDGSYSAKISLLSNAYKKELGRNSGQIVVLISEGDKSSKTILDRCVNGEYKISASKITRKEKQWFINLSYNFEPCLQQLDKENILGIDMGIVYPIYMAVYNSHARESIMGGEIEQFRKQVERRKYELQKQGRHCGDGRIGHGIKTRIKPLAFAKSRIANFRDTINHKYSRRVIEFAIRHNCGTIQMEDLSGINTRSKFLKNWPYYDLQQKITYKAKGKGITVLLIDPRYTSQRCSKCGFTDRDNRPEQEKFCCKACGFETNADYNAALNIATPNIENLIKENIKREA